MSHDTHLKYTISRLDNHHDKKSFSCGSPYLDNYLKLQAGQDAKKNVSVAYVLTEASSNQVIGYYTLSSIGIDVGELPVDTVSKLPKYPRLPGILLGRLAVDKRPQGKQIGSRLLIDALKRSLTISQQIGIMAVIVDAKDSAAVDFYKHYGFIEFLDNQLKLFIPISTIKQLP